MSKSFVSSVFTYAQNAMSSRAAYTKARNDAPMLYSSFKYNGGFWPKEIIARVGNLVSHTCKPFFVPAISLHVSM